MRASDLSCQCTVAHHVDEQGRSRSRRSYHRSSRSHRRDSLRLRAVSPDRRSPSYDFQKDDPPHQSWEAKSYDRKTKSHGRSQPKYRQGWSYSRDQSHDHQAGRTADQGWWGPPNHQAGKTSDQGWWDPKKYQPQDTYNTQPSTAARLSAAPLSLNPNLLRHFPTTTPNRLPMTKRSTHTLQSQLTLSGTTRPSKSANQNLNRTPP